ncbi:MAG: AMP-binding protein, partial [Advenella sp.]
MSADIGLIGNDVMLKPVKNIGNFLTDVSLRFADLPGLIHGDRTYSWGELNARVDSLAHALSKLGIGKGDRILIHSSNNVQLFESCWATFKLGAIWVPTNVRITESEIAYLASTSTASIVIYDDGYAGHANSCCHAADSVRHVIAIGEPQQDEHNYEALLALHRSDGRFEAVDVDYEDPLWFFFTSGTTGFPKAGVLSHGQMAFVITNHLADLLPGIDQHSRSLVVAPLSHGAGIHAIANTARGAASILPASARLDCAEAWQLVQQYRVDNMFTVPTIVKRLTEDPAVDQFDHSSLKYVIYA